MVAMNLSPLQSNIGTTSDGYIPRLRIFFKFIVLEPNNVIKYIYTSFEVAWKTS